MNGCRELPLVWVAMAYHVTRGVIPVLVRKAGQRADEVRLAVEAMDGVELVYTVRQVEVLDVPVERPPGKERG